MTTRRLLGASLDKRKKYVGWKEIAAILERSEKEAQRLEARQFDPLPVRRLGGMPWMLHSAFEAWLDRQDMPGQTHLELTRTRRAVRTLERLNSRDVSPEVATRRPRRAEA
jgi:hypothetical protein